MNIKKKALFIIFPFLVMLALVVMHPGMNVLAQSQNMTSELPEEDPYHLELSDYDHYLASKDQVFPDVTIDVDIFDYDTQLGEDYDVSKDTLDGKDALLTPEEGLVEWSFDVDEAGLYNIEFLYYSVIGNSSPIERAIYVNGDIVFDELRAVTFYRHWEDTFNVSEKRDEDLNDIKPSQVEAPQWQSEFIRDMRGKHLSPFYVWLDEGENTLSLQSLREPMAIGSITLTQADEIMSYHETLSLYESLDLKTIDLDSSLRIQGEDASFKSSPTLYPINDRTSMRTDPYHSSLIRLNAIGGYNWRDPGDYIAWEVEVEEEGLYQLTIKALQNFSRGTFSTRTLYVNGDIPFTEAKNLEFNYDSQWQNKTFGNDEGSFYIHLEEGVNEIRLAAAMGRYGELIEEVQDVIQELNTLYREIIMFTSVQPDPYRDYQLRQRIPDLNERLSENREILMETAETVMEITGGRSSQIAIIERVAMQLEDFEENPRVIQNRINEFRENISSLGTWVLTTIEQPLTIDYLLIHDADYTPPRAHSNFFERIWHEVRIFFASFFMDYSVLRESEIEDGESIEVWLSADLLASAQQQAGAMSAGRDQANVLRQLIDETFTPESGISVELKVVNHDVLLPATLAGNGPDVAMSVNQEQPVNFAMRNALYDLTNFDDFDEVKGRFFEGAMMPYTYNEGYYALPEQYIFLLMFYRTDILEELELEPPRTWEEVIEIIPELQRYNLDFFLPQTPANLNPLYYAMLSQKGGSLYTDDAREIALLDEAGTSSFEMFANFYADYSFTVTANFANRFRSGEMPIGVTYYSEYNTLSVFAPEIRGQWDFMELPGTKQPDGSIDNTSAANSNATVLLNDSDNKEASWEFMKWWSSTDTQVRFGREMEGILGAAARYPTANIEALEQLPWPTRDYRLLHDQASRAKGVPVVPGSYITGRYIDNAYRAVINDGVNPRESLFDYSRRINAEIARKRVEFGLD